ncbi:MAG: beta-ketoacyl-[acyl-carrier-protein] synthase family protein [bacterium]
MSTRKRVAITGMAINTPLGDTLDGHLEALLAGRSAVTRWRSFPVHDVLCKVGADLEGYDIAARFAALAPKLPPAVAERAHGLVRRVPWSTRLSILLALDAALDAGLFETPTRPERMATLVAGHNVNNHYGFLQRREFEAEPDFIDGLYALYALDTDHAGCVSEVLGCQGPICTLGGACASGNVALRQAVDEIRHHGIEVAVVVGAVLDHAPIDFHAMAIMGAVTHKHFNDRPAEASRPFDTRREGFVPAHGGAVLVLEDWDRAVARGARIHAELLGVELGADACHLPQPSADGQQRVMKAVLAGAGIAPEQVDYVNAHATSTPLGDLTEISALRAVFGARDRLKVNASKSMLGHTCWSAAVVETVGAVLQMNAGRLHPSINIDVLDPEVDLDVCRAGAIEHPVEVLMKNAFGFGGINSVSLIRRVDR